MTTPSPRRAGTSGWPRRGFTLLELLVVMAIIGLLAAFVAPRYFSQIGQSNSTLARAQVAALVSALDQYRLQVGRYPSTQQGLQALMVAPPGEARWAGPYLKKDVPNDPWGRAFVYKAPGQHGDFDLSSLGRDGQAGGSGEDADVHSW
ncbi:type II secretion system major pseudopilin GspG [Pseudaquabacterium pictum]|uniref:Type II secretion system core protein G n=1 Tax=Pseudaquabacterium pictum TaxID=2315236 RepID=A0A480B1Q0_9BURK|nr:type II secretion system major pseudopilin GspG [Rubrivivax pictus]GCL66277.1 type II secretion system protein GspG [Rubrivivax pictus]